MSIQTELTRITNAKAAIKTAIEGKGVTVPSDTLLDGMASLIESIEAGGGATEPYIEEVIDGNGDITNATLHGYTIIRNNAFYNCSKLALVSLSSGLTSIGNNAFYSCSKLALTSLPSGLTSIGDSAFYNCSKLALTSLPSSLTSIGIYAFYGCSSLASLTFEGKPKSISNSAFNECTNLTTINVPWAPGAVANAPWGAINATINYNAGA